MEYKNFQLKILMRIGILFVSLLILVLALTGSKNYVTITVFFILLIIELSELFNFLRRINREVGHFVDALKKEDYTVNYHPERSDKIFRSLRNSLGEVMQDLKTAREKEQIQNLYLQMLLDHLETGILVYDRKLNLKLENHAAKLIFQGGRDIAHFDNSHAQIADFIRNALPGEKKVYQVNNRSKSLQLSLRKGNFSLKGDEYQLISLQDIHFELDEKETDSWYRLIRILTHEIMNTITPISSLSEAVYEELKESTRLNPGSGMEDIMLGLKTIHSRSRDLMKFISNYKKLTRTQEPDFANQNIRDLVEEVVKLFEGELKARNIKIGVQNFSQDSEIRMDREMIMRVLINLIQNAIDATANKNQGRITLRYENLNGETMIILSDTGEGIPEEIISDIFIPFFTTKAGGSGIGLSLSRKIMQLHNGSIQIRSEIGKGTEITLLFPEAGH